MRPLNLTKWPPAPSGIHHNSTRARGPDVITLDNREPDVKRALDSCFADASDLLMVKRLVVVSQNAREIGEHMPSTVDRIGRTTLVLSLLAAALGILASGAALLIPNFYHRDPAIISPQLLGQDLVTIPLAIILIASAWLARKGSMRATIATAGLLFYFAYTYATYSFGARFNALFLVYVAILGISTYALFLIVPRLAPSSEPDWSRIPRRSLISLLYGIVVLFSLLWGSDIVPALLAGTTPNAAREADTPTSFIHILDLAYLLPLGAIAGTLLLRKRAWGVPLAGLFLVKGIAISVAVLSMALFVHLAGLPVNVPVTSAMAVTVVLFAVVGARYARALPLV
jgi:hypothetical protein